MLIVLWVIGCLLQYFFCCRGEVQKPVLGAETKPAIVAPVETPVAVTTITETIETPVANNPTLLGFRLKGDGIDLSGEDNFNFPVSGYVPMQPYAKGLESNLAKTVEYLNENSARQLTVIGLYSPDEKNPSVFPNIGLARANQVKDYLAFLGVNSQQIKLTSQAFPEAVSTEDQRYLGMVAFDTETLDESGLDNHKKAMAALAEEIRANPIALYFKTGATEIELSESQRQRLLQVANYLDFEPTAKLIVTGHTDNTGNRENNIKLGKERALFVSNYLEKNGLRRERLYIASQGPDSPIADNNTAEGRAKNRRVTLSIYEKSQ